MFYNIGLHETLSCVALCFHVQIWTVCEFGMLIIGNVLGLFGTVRSGHILWRDNPRSKSFIGSSTTTARFPNADVANVTVYSFPMDILIV